MNDKGIIAKLCKPPRSDSYQPRGRQELREILDTIITEGMRIRRETFRPDNLSAAVAAILEINKMDGNYHDAEPKVPSPFPIDSPENRCG